MSLFPTELDKLRAAEMEARSARAVARECSLELGKALQRIQALQTLINTPKTDDFFEAVKLEAAHQVERWGTAHDAGKAPEDWFWLLGYLSGKALAAAVLGDQTKALHHTISSAAVLLNWHRALSGAPTAMRPGIAEPTTSPAHD